MKRKNAIFIMCVQTDALISALIQNGDYIRCEQTDKLDEGQLGVVRTPYGILLRFVYFVSKSYVRLDAANIDFPSLCLNPNDVHIIGRPLTLQRDIRRVQIWEDQ